MEFLLTRPIVDLGLISSSLILGFGLGWHFGIKTSLPLRQKNGQFAPKHNAPRRLKKLHYQDTASTLPLTGGIYHGLELDD